MERQKALSTLKQEVVDHFSEAYPEEIKTIKEAFSKNVKKVSRDIVLTENKRIDGRAFDEIRGITCEVGNLPRPQRNPPQPLGLGQLGLSQMRQHHVGAAQLRQSVDALHRIVVVFGVQLRKDGLPEMLDVAADKR